MIVSNALGKGRCGSQWNPVHTKSLYLKLEADPRQFDITLRNHQCVLHIAQATMPDTSRGFNH